MTTDHLDQDFDRWPLINKIRKWIEEKVPAHSKADYKELLIKNEKLAIEIYQLHHAFESLTRAYNELQKEIAYKLPYPNISLSMKVEQDTILRDYIWKLKWDIPPGNACLSVNHWHPFTVWDQIPLIREAYYKTLENNLLPKLKEDIDRLINSMVRDIQYAKRG